jgi:Transglycosylase SLT domain/LysM domain
MRAAVRRTIAAGALATLAGALVFVGTRRFVRDVISSFVTPLPIGSTPTPPEALSGLPNEVALAGGESRELARLAAVKAPAPVRGSRLAMFPSPVRQGGPPSDRIAALRRPEMIQRDDARIDDMMNYWLRDGRAHAALLAAFQRSGRYRPTTDRILGAWKVPEDLSAMIFLESGFVPSAVQPDGGAGLWSLPLDVAQTYGITVREAYDERRGVESSTEVAGRYLADMKERFGSWPLAIYAFAHGYKRTADEFVKTHSTKFEDLADARKPDSAYVFQVFALATILENPERFGLDAVRPDPPLATSDMEVPSEAPLSVIAQAAGTSVVHLHELNPEYLGETVPTTGTAMIIHLPREGLARAKELLTPLLYAPPGSLAQQVGRVDDPDAEARAKAAHSAENASRSGPSRPVPSVPGQPSYYRVRDGETLDTLAGRFGVARETIASDNALDVTAPLSPGQLLRIRAPSPRD